MFDPPFAITRFDHTKTAWHLFDLYLRFVLPYPNLEWHPCSKHLHSVHEAASISLEAIALAMGVAVEGITKVLFNDRGALPEGFKPRVKNLRAHVLKWEGLAELERDFPGVGKRLNDLYGKLNEVNSTRRLNDLAREGKVETSFIKVWKNMRNTAAHAGEPNSSERQHFIDAIGTVTVLMYQVIFAAIGYRGSYTDYSSHGYPTKQYPPERDENK